MKKELEKVNKKPLEEILDMTSDITISEAIIDKLKAQRIVKVKVGEKVNGSIVKNQEEAEHIKTYPKRK